MVVGAAKDLERMLNSTHVYQLAALFRREVTDAIGWANDILFDLKTNIIPEINLQPLYAAFADLAKLLQPSLHGQSPFLLQLAAYSKVCSEQLNSCSSTVSGPARLPETAKRLKAQLNDMRHAILAWATGVGQQDALGRQISDKDCRPLQKPFRVLLVSEASTTFVADCIDLEDAANIIFNTTSPLWKAYKSQQHAKPEIWISR